MSYIEEWAAAYEQEEIKMTPEKIKEIADQPRGDYELVVSEVQAIYAAAEKSPFEMICYAYAYGFHRGQQARKEKRHE